MDTRRLLLLLFYSWIVASTFLTSAVNGEKPRCDQLNGTYVLTDSADICVDPWQTLGNPSKPVILDFSIAKNGAFELLAKGFYFFHGAFVMNGNEQVETLNFKAIGNWRGYSLPDDSVFISIRNNPNLKQLQWDQNVKTLDINNYDKSIRVMIYNNPQLNMASVDMFEAALKKDIAKDIKYTLQTRSGECQFENVYNRTDYSPPTAAILPHCKRIKGDFKMTNGSLANLHLMIGRDSCLQLVNVDMTGAQLTLFSGNLAANCKDGSQSMIKNNKNLCGDDLKELENYFKNPKDVIIQPDKSTCTIECTTPEEKSQKYHVCKEEAKPSTTSKGKGDEKKKDEEEATSEEEEEEVSWLIVGVCSGINGLLIIIGIVLILWWKDLLPWCSEDDDDEDEQVIPSTPNTPPKSAE